MSNAGKAFSILAILFSVVSAGLGFMLASQNSQRGSQLVAAESALRSVSGVPFAASVLEDTSQPAAGIKRVSDKLKSTTTALNETKTTLDDTKKKLVNAEAKSSDLESKLASKDGQLKKTKSELASAKSSLASVEKELKGMKDVLKGRPVEKVVADLEQRSEDLEVLRAEKKVVEDAMAKLERENQRLQGLETRRKEQVAPLGLSGRVVAINKDWNFVVLDVGKNDELVEGIPLTVYRGDELVGKIKTVSVEDKTAVADILPEWTQGEIQIGDKVLF